MNKLTGYPHIDRPWMKYYDESIVNMEEPKTNLTEYLKIKTDGNRSLLAHTYYGKDMTLDEFFYKVDIASKVLTELGVKKGEIVMNMLPNIPEAAQIWLGCAQIGAIADFIDPRPDSMDIMANAQKVLEVIKYEKAKYIVALDRCYLAMLKPIEQELKELGIEKIVIISASDSMNLVGKIDYLKDVLKYNELKNIRNDSLNVKKLRSYEVLLSRISSMQKEERMFKDAINSSILKVLRYSDLVGECKYTKFQIDTAINTVNYIGHTSGTSGARPKPIPATNKNGISALEQLVKGNASFNKGDNALHVLPYFAPFGAYDNYLFNIVCCANNIDVPEFEINEFGYLIKKYHPNIVMGTPAWLAALPDYSYLTDEDLSCIHTIIYGGDSMSPSDEEKVNKWLKAHGSNAEIEKGYGMSEFLGCGSYAQDSYNKLGSIGIPLPNTIYSIVDPNIDDRLVPLKFNEGEERLKGELVVSSDAVTDGKLHGDIIVPRYEMNDKSYIRTRDLVEMDRDGIFYHESRKDRSFTRFDGYKIKPYEIESIIEKNAMVKYAKLVEYFDDRQRGIMPICHLVLNDNSLTAEEQIEVVRDIVYNNIIGNPTMSSRQIPSKFKIRMEMPLTKNSKIDFNALKNEPLDGSEINVDVSETNLTVDHIQIYRGSRNIKIKIKK
ncbi:MAG: AMP-binding protein [Bacilli bacterium]